MTRLTSILAVDADLKARAHPEMVDNYPYRLGMCEALLAEANAELERKDREIARLTADLDAVPDHRSIR
jgi:hypothetical protein